LRFKFHEAVAVVILSGAGLLATPGLRGSETPAMNGERLYFYAR
jgi:hypothetical protein